MEHWIFISSTKRFRMRDWLAVNDYVEFEQRNKVQVNDIVFLYTTAPECKIEFKMIVDKVDILQTDAIDDSAYSLIPTVDRPRGKFVRLRLLETVNEPKLHLSMLRNYGLKSSMQSNLRVDGELLDYIESFFNK